MPERIINRYLGEPTWEVAHLFPCQGHWSEGEFLALHTNRMVELNAGRLEVLPMPSWLHQLIVTYLFKHLDEFVRTRGVGTVLFAPLPVRLFPGTIREPDVLYVSREHTPHNLAGYPEKIDLAMEVVSPGAESRQRDYEEKRIDYARAGVSEYWIIDPEKQQITVLSLQDGSYRETGVYRSGEIAKSVLLDGFSIDVCQVMELGHKKD